MRVKRVDRKCFQEREEEGTFFFLFSSFFTGLGKYTYPRLAIEPIMAAENCRGIGRV